MTEQDTNVLEILIIDMDGTERSAKRWAYSDMPSEASHSAIVPTGFPLALRPQERGATMVS